MWGTCLCLMYDDRRARDFELTRPRPLALRTSCRLADAVLLFLFVWFSTIHIYNTVIYIYSCIIMNLTFSRTVAHIYVVKGKVLFSPFFSVREKVKLKTLEYKQKQQYSNYSIQ